MNDAKNDPLKIALACHDPAGTSVGIRESELFNHMLVLGATGSGKTTRVILPAFDDLCRSFNGLLLIDCKRDQRYLDGIRESVERHGRTLIELDGSGRIGFDLFGPMKSRGLDGVDEVAERLCSGAPIDERNRYWDIVFGKVVKAALAMLVLASPEFGYDEAVDWLETYLMSFSPMNPSVLARENRLDELLENEDDARKAARVRTALRVHRMWSELDSRTRSNHQSLAAAVLDALSSTEACRYLAAESFIDLEKSLDEGDVVLFRFDSMANRGLARFLCSCLKACFYRGLFKRESDLMPWGLILDDWSLAVSGGMDTDTSDVVALAHIRSKRGFVIAACQSLADIDDRIGKNGRAAAVANFGTLVFMRNRDLEVDRLAERAFFGHVKELQGTVRSGLSPMPPMIVRTTRETTLLPVGKLSRLEVGEAWVSICGSVVEQSVMLAPYWEKRETWDALL